MHTIKLVVIGASGVGKTSLRGQYISGRFSSGYRATIGADFIAKTLPHPTKPGQTVTLQIWDTAGQERFSSLSTAFFRGADAVILMFDVHQIETLEALKKWWGEFCERAPLTEEDIPEYPCFIVGNKIDLTTDDNDDGTLISKDQALHFITQLVPPDADDDDDIPPPTVISPTDSDPLNLEDHKPSYINMNSHVTSIDELASKHRRTDQSRYLSRPTSKFGTGSSINTTLSIYHTPSSSFFSDSFHTARSSPEPTPGTSPPHSQSIIRQSTAPMPRQRRLTALSTGSTSSDSAATITPSLFARSQRENVDTALTTPEDILPDSDSTSHHGLMFSTTTPPLLPERGPTLSFTSAKTGQGVKELFEQIASRVMRKLEYEEHIEARRMHFREASGAETIRLGISGGQTSRSTFGDMKIGSCCR